MADVFISYSRRDKEFVCRLSEALKQTREAWVDWKDIPPTSEWQQEILANIERADNFVFIISPDSVVSPNCRSEIAHAGANNKRMVPILYRSVPDELIPEAVRKYQRIDFGDERDFRSTFDLLVQTLDTDLAWTEAHTRLLTRAKEWERAAEDSSFLLRGNDLLAAQQWIGTAAEHEPTPTPLHSRYILVSHQVPPQRIGWPADHGGRPDPPQPRHAIGEGRPTLAATPKPARYVSDQGCARIQGPGHSAYSGRRAGSVKWVHALGCISPDGDPVDCPTAVEAFSVQQ